MNASEKNELRDFLTHAPQREDAGRTASDRFDYQKNWALVRLLSLHRKDGDYVLLCEFHEDVTIIDNTVNPTVATFFQIKTSDSKLWTVKRLINRKKNSKGEADLPSILGKLCSKASSLADQAVTYQFVTNSGFSYKSASGKAASLEDASEHLASTLLHSDEWKALTEALITELGIDLSGHLQENLSFAVAELPLKMHGTATLGAVSEFLEEFAPGAGIAPQAFYRTLFDELKRRTVASKPSGGLSAICKTKGIDRKAFDAMLMSAIKVVPSTTAWPIIMQELQNDGLPLATRLDLNAASKSCYVRSLSTTDSAFRSDRRLLISEATKLLANKPEMSLFNLASEALVLANKNNKYGACGLTNHEAITLVMVDLYERQHYQVSDANAQSEEENA